MDVENRVLRGVDSSDGPIEHLLEVDLVEVAGAPPWGHVRVAASKDLVRACVDHIAFSNQHVRRSLGPKQFQHVVRVVVPDVHDDRDPSRLQSVADELQPCPHPVSTELQGDFLQFPGCATKFGPSGGSDRHCVPSPIRDLTLHLRKVLGGKTDLPLTVGIPVIRSASFVEKWNEDLSEDVSSVDQEVRMICVDGVQELSEAHFGTVQITDEENPVFPHGKKQRGRPRYSLDRKSTRLNSSHSQISYAVFCLKKKKSVNVPARTSAKSTSITSHSTHPQNKYSTCTSQ